MNFRFLDPAEEEMTEAARVYEDHAVGLGKRFLDEVEGCVDLLLDRPYIGRRVGKFRRFPLRKFPRQLHYVAPQLAYTVHPASSARAANTGSFSVCATTRKAPLRRVGHRHPL